MLRWKRRCYYLILAPVALLLASHAFAECGVVQSATPIIERMQGQVSSLRFKVCGSWPACSACVDMRDGDCMYIFPTHFLVFTDRHDTSKICVCQVVGGCGERLPEHENFTDNLYGKTCFQKKCFNKPSDFYAPDAGPFCNLISYRDCNARFVPMEFSKQRFSAPGFVAISRCRGTSKAHVINPGVDASSGRVSEKDKVISEQPKHYSFKSTEDATHYLTAQKSGDSVCVKYYGTAGRDVGSLLRETCIPIPIMEKPVMYQVKDNGGRIAQRVEIWGQGYDFGNASTIRATTNAPYSGSGSSSGPYIEHKFDGYKVDEFLGKGKLDEVDFANLSVSDRKFSMDCSDTECKYVEKNTSGYRNSRIACIPNRLPTEMSFEVVSTSGNAQPVGTGLSKEKEAMQRLQLSGSSAPKAKELYEKVTGTGASSTKSSSDSVIKTWIKEAPKTLRRYVEINEYGVRKRVACEDKYSVDLRLLSQESLNEAIVDGDKFVLPQSVLGGTVGESGDDPCYNMKKYHIVHYYESGGFTLWDSACPSQSYGYHQGHKVSGCEYQYISMDDYKPFFPEQHSLNAINLNDQGLCVDSFPRYWYEPRPGATAGRTTATKAQRILTIDVSGSAGLGARATKATGTSASGSASSGVKTTQATTSGTNASGSRPTASNSKWGGVQCQFYKIEIWGGGGAASTDSTGGKISGRPGQYAMGVLPGKYAGATTSSGKFHVEIEIGEGGTASLAKGGDTVVKLCEENTVTVTTHKGTGTPTTSTTTRSTCREIMRAVGGGSDALNEPKEDIKKWLLYYRSISGDVIKGDKGADKLLEGGHAMFTKFPIEMNLPLSSANASKVIKTREYFWGRSLPRELCHFKESLSTVRTENELFVPGMGGCWNGDKQGVGENGAVMLTCEVWN